MIHLHPIHRFHPQCRRSHQHLPGDVSDLSNCISVKLPENLPGFVLKLLQGSLFSLATVHYLHLFLQYLASEFLNISDQLGDLCEILHIRTQHRLELISDALMFLLLRHHASSSHPSWLSQSERSA